MTDGVVRERVRERLGWPADPATHRRIRRLWQRHSIAEDRRDIDGLVSTLAPGCVYEIVGAGHVPFPGDPQVPLDYCLGQALP